AVAFDAAQLHSGRRDLLVGGGLGRTAVENKLRVAKVLLRPEQGLRVGLAFLEREMFAAHVPARGCRRVRPPLAQVKARENGSPAQVHWSGERRGSIAGGQFPDA